MRQSLTLPSYAAIGVCIGVMDWDYDRRRRERWIEWAGRLVAAAFLVMAGVVIYLAVRAR